MTPGAAAGTPLRILHLNPQDGWRGGERQTLLLASELVRAGHLSELAARPDEPLARRAADAGLTVHAIAPMAPVAPLAALRLRRLVRRRDFDIVHAHTANAVTLGALGTAGTGAALVVTRRVDFALNPGLLTEWKYARAGAIIAISSAVRDILVADGVAAERVVVVPDGVDLDRPMTPASTDTLRALGVRGGVPLVVMVAALVAHKAPVDFVHAVAAARGAGAAFEALLVGDGPLMGEVRAARAAAGLETSLLLAGWRDDADSLIAAADVFVLSSREEGLGSVLLDAMQCGVPVAATRAGGIPEIVVDGETGLLAAPGDPAALGASLARLCGDPDLRRRLGAAGRARVGDYGMARVAERTVAVYRSALAGRRQAR